VNTPVLLSTPLPDVVGRCKKIRECNLDDRTPDIIRNAQNGDTEAFRELIDLYGPRIYRIAYQTSGNSEDARDIAQEVFIRLHKKLGTFRHTSKFTTWLYRMTVNLSIDYLRKNAGRGIVSIDSDGQTPDFPDTGGLPDAHAELSELKGVVAKLTAYLTPNQRKVFVLRDLQDFSTPDIADVLKCSGATVRVHLANARRRIRDALVKHYPHLAERNTSGGED
jgi:RNA polymerase sigma-70 factor, ECF subfamily